MKNLVSIVFYLLLPFAVFFTDFIVNLIFSLVLKKRQMSETKKIFITKRIVCILAVSLLLAFVVGLRSSSKAFHVGSDTAAYRNFYESLRGLSLNQVYSLKNNYEKGFMTYCYIFSALRFNYYLFSFITYFLIYVLTSMFSYKFSRYPSLTMSLFICFGLFTINMSTIRQSLAISFCLLSFVLIYDKKWIIKPLGLIPLLLSISIHRSSVFVVFALLISLIPLNKKIHVAYFSIIFVSLIIVFIPLSHYIFMNVSDTVRVYSFYPTALVPFLLSGTEVLLIVLILTFIAKKCFSFPKKSRDLSLSKAPLNNINGYISENQVICNKYDMIALSLMAFQLLLCVCDNFMFLVARAAIIGSMGICLFVPNYLFSFSSKRPHILIFMVIVFFGAAYFYFTTLRINYLELLPYGVFK